MKRNIYKVISCFSFFLFFHASAVSVQFVQLNADKKFRTSDVIYFESLLIQNKITLDDISNKDLKNPIYFYFRALINFNNGDDECGLNDLKIALENGVAVAAITLGDIYEVGLFGHEVNTDIALRYYKNAVDLGSVEGKLREAALMYQIHGANDFVVKIYESLASSNHPVALFNLGVIYEKDKDDLEKSIDYYKKASLNGHNDASYNLFVILSSQEHVFHNPTEGYQYLVNAADNGHIESQYHLAVGLIENSEDEDEELKKRGISLMHIVAENKYMYAHKFLADYYSKIIDSEESYFRAEKWLKRAAEGGDDTSLRNLLQLYLAYAELVPSAKTNAAKMQESQSKGSGIKGLVIKGSEPF